MNDNIILLITLIMSTFCEICHNLLSIVATSDTFHFRCVKCVRNYKPSDNDTLRFEQVIGTNLGVYRTILQTAGKDPVNPKVEKKCIRCNNDIIRQVRLGREMRLINVCPKCNKQWIEGLDTE